MTTLDKHYTWQVLSNQANIIQPGKYYHTLQKIAYLTNLRTAGKHYQTW